MANYDAQINILVAGQRNIQNLANQLSEIENTIGQIERRWRNASGALQRANIRLGVTGTELPRGQGGRFASDPDRRARLAALTERRRAAIEQRVSRLAIGRSQAEAIAARNRISDNETFLRQTERRIILESRLNSANELFQRRVQQFARGGRGGNIPEELRTQARSIQAAYEAAGGAGSRNLRLVQALATEMGRVVERQNEFNRLQSLGSKGFEAGRRLQERITAASSMAELPAQSVRRVRSLATDVIAASRSGDQQAYSEALRRATTATARLERESRELASAMNEQEREIARIARIAPRSPVGGGVNFPGSPKALEQQRRNESRARMLQEKAAKAAERAADKALSEAQKGYPSSPILGTATIQGSPRWKTSQEIAKRKLESAAKAAERAADKALSEAQKGYPSSPILGTATMEGSPKWKIAQEKAIAAQERAAKAQERAASAAESAANKALRDAQKGYPSSPIMGSVNIPGSPIYNQTPFLERRFGKRGASAISEGLIGGAFPLLFGQGIGASLLGGLGGAAGGFAGGGLGFGLSLLGTGLGSALDALGKAAEDTGKSLNYPIEGFDKLKEANLFASRQQEYYISKLIESGQIAKAQSEIQAEIIKKVGIGGVNDLMALGDASTRLSKAWASFTLELQAALAGPMAGLLNWITNIVTLSSGGIQRQAAQFNPSAFNEAQVKAKDKAMQGRLIGVMNEKIYQEELNRLSAQIVARYNKDLRVAPTQLTQQDQENQLNKAIEIADQIRSMNQEGMMLQREGGNLRLSIEDTVYGLRKRAADIERDAANFRRSVEDEIFNKKQDLERMIIDNDRRRQQNAIDALDLQMQQAGAILDPIAQGVVDAARQYIKVRAEGEADLQQSERQLKLDLQKIDQEVSRYQLQVQERVSQMSLQRDEFTRDVARTKLQIEQQIGDYAIRIEKYRLDMAKLRVAEAIREGDVVRATEIARQEGLGVSASGRNYADVGGFIGRRQMLHGIPGFAGYDAGHAGDNAHYHFAGANPRETKAVADYLRSLNYTITEFGQYGQAVGRHARGSQHYREQGFNAFDVPGSQVPVGQEIPMMKRVHALINDFLGAPGSARGPSTPVLPPPPSQTAPAAPALPTMPQLPTAPQLVGVNDLMAQYLEIQKQIQAQMQATNALEKARLSIQLESARLQYEQQALNPIAQFEEQNRQLAIEIEKRKLINRLSAEGVAPELIEGEVRLLEIRRALNSVLLGNEEATNATVRAAIAKYGLDQKLIDSSFRLSEATITQLLLTTKDVKAQEELRKELERILALRNQIAGKAQTRAEGAAAGAGTAAADSMLSPQEKMQKEIGAVKEELSKLVDPVNQIKQAAYAIGDAFSASFKGIISGSMTAQEALASFFRNIADYFLEMAAQIITKMIIIKILNAATNLLPVSSVPSLGPVATAAGVVPRAGFMGPAFADGGMFANGIQPFAMGGIVSSPTLFKFAQGGAMRTGLMGEAGPEGILPLSRGPGGRLGVDASGIDDNGGVNVTVNVDATGSKVQGDSGRAGELGRAISAAVQQELIKQKRNGGLLA